MIPELGKGLSATPGRCPTTRSLGAARWTQRLRLRSSGMGKLGLEILGLGRLSAAPQSLAHQSRVPDPSPQILPGTLTAWQPQEHPRPLVRSPHLPSSQTSRNKLTTWSIATLWNPRIAMRRLARVGKGSGAKSDPPALNLREPSRGSTVSGETRSQLRSRCPGARKRGRT